MITLDRFLNMTMQQNIQQENQIKTLAIKQLENNEINKQIKQTKPGDASLLGQQAITKISEEAKEAIVAMWKERQNQLQQQRLHPAKNKQIQH